MSQVYSLTHIASRCSALVDGAILTSSDLNVDGELASSGIRWNRATLTDLFTAKLNHCRSQYDRDTTNNVHQQFMACLEDSLLLLRSSTDFPV
ncbi:hypothetical protein HAPAU_38440 [Halalkalicoccus paucihalophilus]|uniref:Uncharacterized protein n=1 Tax=Halalkalicoccus paucihalophilus TaxID=1008153 RepID=A0A151A803_9EURY|nr:hypothetical protein HAPAU_38440 [Halalkalicoccus paucihalophilus]